MTIASRLVAATQVSWRRLALIVAINTGIALVLWVEDPRPFWHPMVTVQSYGLSIAWFFNLLAPWKSRAPIWTTVLAALLGVAVGTLLVVVLKQYSLYDIATRPGTFFWTAVSAFACGLFVCLQFLLNFREAEHRVDLERGEAERQRLARVAADARLEALQAQVQPHFLFNSLGTVQALIDADPPAASRLLGHLTDYLRSAMIEVRERTVTLESECQRVRAFLEIMQIRLGARLRFSIACPEALAQCKVPPHLIASLAENAIKHGVELSGAGRIEVAVEQRGKELQIGVCNYPDRPLPAPASAAPRTSHGLGHRNLRETLAALYGDAARFEFQQDSAGARAIITLPV